MEGIILTIEQKENINGVLFAPYIMFNCVQDINNNWFTFLTDEDKELIKYTNFNWLLDCNLQEYVPKVYNIEI
jgi:hypothetical protein